MNESAHIPGSEAALWFTSFPHAVSVLLIVSYNVPADDRVEALPNSDGYRD